MTPAPFKPASPRSKAAPDKFSVALLLNVPANKTEPVEAKPELAPPVAANDQGAKAKPASSVQVAVASAKPAVARPTRPMVERPSVSRAKRVPAPQIPAISPVTREGVSAKLALVKAKSQVDRPTPPPPVVPTLVTQPAASVASDRPAREPEVARQAVSRPPPVPVSPVVEALPLATVDAPSMDAMDALPLATVDALPLATVDAPSMDAMDAHSVPAAAVVTERPRMLSLRIWRSSHALPRWITSLTPQDALRWLPSQTAVLDSLRRGRRMLISASARVTEWGVELAAAQAWRRINRPTLWVLGSSLLFALSLVTLLLARGPAGHGESLLRARAEVTAVERHFDAREAERNLAEQARAEGRMSLVVKVPAFSKRRRVTTEPQTLSLAPLSEVKLETLAQIEAHALPGSTVTVYAPDVEALASAVGLRLGRRASLDTVTLEQVELFWADVSEQDADLELLVATLRERSLEAKRALSGSRRVVDRLSAAGQNRAPAKGFFTRNTTARRSPALGQAGRLLKERRKASQEAQASYEEAAQRAERYALKPARAPGPAGVAAARVTVRFGTETTTFDVPVRVHAVPVRIAPPAGVGFGATHAAFAWDAVKDKTPKAAVVTLASLVPWQTQAIGLMKALPCLFLGLICVLSFRMLRPETRRALASRMHSVAAGTYEHLCTLVTHLRSVAATTYEHLRTLATHLRRR